MSGWLDSHNLSSMCSSLSPAKLKHHWLHNATSHWSKDCPNQETSLPMKHGGSSRKKLIRTTVGLWPWLNHHSMHPELCWVLSPALLAPEVLLSGEQEAMPDSGGEVTLKKKQRQFVLNSQGFCSNNVGPDPTFNKVMRVTEKRKCSYLISALSHHLHTPFLQRW